MGAADRDDERHHARQGPDGRSFQEPGESLEDLCRTPMASWYSPFKLAKTASDIAVSALLGPRADFRVIEALGDEQHAFDYSTADGPDHVEEPGEPAPAPRASMWLDYVADVGDGFNSTFTIASLLARAELEVDGHVTRRGEVLVMGGDEAYPSASRETYQRKLVRPYELAIARRGRDDVVADLFAIPGNHDWYDGLTSFMRLFGQERTLSAWRTRQSRSYFALKLPQGVWLLGVDIQLNADIDRPQREHFCEIAERRMRAGDRILLCTAEPDWVVGKVYDPRVQDNLAYFERTLLERRPGLRVIARIAGDLHHYRRHTSERGEHNLIAGGGGAFLHPTHGEDVTEVHSGPRGAESVYRLQKSFPEVAESRRLAWRNLGFLLWNPGFSAFAAAAYALLALLVLREGIASLVAVALFLGLVVMFTDTSRIGYRLAGGAMHGLVHTAAAVVLTQALLRRMGLLGYPRLIEGVCGAARCFRLEQAPLWRELVVLLGAGAAGAIAGPFLLGAYLLVSLNGFRRHGNEAFSSLRIQDYKNFLRMRIEPGKLTIYPIGVKRVPRRWAWRERAAPGEPLVVPVDREISARLIEEPIVIALDDAPGGGEQAAREVA